MNKVICPNCGAEYAPQEIFLFNSFNNSKIIKDEEGKILDNLDFDDNESYKCDYCNKTFFAKMAIDFEVSTTKVEEYVTKLRKPALFFKEEE